MIKMPKEMKQRWVDALRSGKYKQAQGALEKDGGYCCLGVLQMVVDRKVETLHETDLFKNEYEHPAVLPSAAWCERNKITIEDQSWGVACEVEYVDVNGNEQVCSDLPSFNDEAYMSFREIADIIEEQVEGT